MSGLSTSGGVSDHIVGHELGISDFLSIMERTTVAEPERRMQRVSRDNRMTEVWESTDGAAGF